jgi:purine-binding chemotaxis protein CheW
MASVATLTDTTIVGENEEQLVTMIVDNQLFGIPILQVQDIVEASKITPVPLAPSAIAGVLNLRGRIVTVIDLRKLLGNTEEVPWDSQMGVTVEYKGDLYTLLVDAIGDVRTLPKRDFDSAPSTMEDKVRQICAGIFRLRGNLLVVLDVARILLPEAIEATPMLSVEDRRARKEAAQAASDQSRSEKGSQLSTLMTDLNAYESDFDSGLDSLAGEADDIKARKKANRNRRPVNERWQEVLEEKSRREGTTVYRMREPDEEILEDAREEAKEQQATWESEWQARESGEYVSRLPEQEAPTGSDAPPAADETTSTDAESPTGVGELVSDWWSKMRGKSDTDDAEANANANENEYAVQPVAEETPVELPASDEPAPEQPVAEEPAADAAPASEDDGAAKAETAASAGAGKKTRKTPSAKGKTPSKAKKKK